MSWNWPWSKCDLGSELTKILAEINLRLGDLNKVLEVIYKEVRKMSETIDALKAEVAELVITVSAIPGVVESVTVALEGLIDQQAILIEKLEEALAVADPAAIQQATTDLKAQNTIAKDEIAKLAAAVAAIPGEIPEEPTV